MILFRNHFISKCFLVVIASMSLILTGCTKKPSITDAETFFLSSLQGQAGIIGDPSFIFSPPPKTLDVAWQSTGIVTLNAKKGFSGSTAMGTYVRKKENGDLYVLTAKHVIYDAKTLMLKSTDGYFITNFANLKKDYETGSLTKLHLDQLPKTIDSLSGQKDYILIPVAQKNVKSFSFSGGTVAKQQLLFIEKLNPKKLYSIGIKKNKSSNGKIIIFKFYQSNFLLKYSKLHKLLNSNSPTIFTDLDTMPGLSGSPIFYEIDNKVMVIGIMIRRTKKKKCLEFSERICRNKILLLNSNPYLFKK